MKKLLLTISIVLTSLSTFAEKGTLVLRTPREYQIMYVSANGKWATGVYYDDSYNPYAFRWNLESGKIELLSTLDYSLPSGISDEGVVAGKFNSTDITANGAPVLAAGYYDNSWHTLPFKGKFIGGTEMGTSIGAGMSGGISPDGKWIGGSIYADNNLRPVIWHNGEFYKDLFDGCWGVPACISPDGNHMAGWKYIEEGSLSTRYACVWLDGSSKAEILSNYGAPWCTGQMFSPDGKKLLLWGGYANTDPDADSEINALYDLNTHQLSTLKCLSKNPFNQDFNSISNDGTILGYEQNANDGHQRATIYKDGKGFLATEYLRDNNIYDFYTDPNILNDPDIAPFPMVLRGFGLSADSKVMGFFHYTPDGYYGSCVLLLDQEITHRAPCGVEVKQFDGSNIARVSWLQPLVNAENVDKYIVYRDGSKVGECPASSLVFFDKDLSEGTYQYTVSAIYKDAVESEKATSASATVKANELQAPYSLLARQNGFNNATFMWNAPRSNKVVKTYYDAENDNIFGFGAAMYSFELAVRYDNSEFTFYQGKKIEGVSFYPMSTQLGWKATIYEYDEATDEYTVVKEEKIPNDLNIGELNTIKFAEPLVINTQKDLVVGISATVSELTASNSVIGMVYGKCIPGKTDLLRLTTEPKPYSYYDLRQEDGMTNECTWAINLIIDNDAVSADADKVASYNVFADGSLVSSVDTQCAKIPNLSQGKHTLGVEAVFADGSRSNVQTTDLDVNINVQDYAVNDVKVDAQETSSKVKFSWDPPVDRDRNVVAYCTEKPSKQQIRGNKEENWAIQALVNYEAKKLRPFAGSQIRSFRFYPTCDAEFTFALFLNDNIIAYEEVMDYELNQWNEVELEEPVTIVPGLDYQLVLDCYDTTPEESPIGIDGESPFTDVSDLVTTDGESFQSLTNYGVYGNWMIDFVVESAETNPLPVAGYNVSIDGALKTPQPVSEPSFEYDFGEVRDERHTVNVDVVYEGVSETAKGTSTTFYTGNKAAGIQSVQATGKHRADRYYDIAGRRISKPVTGMFINSKKQKTITSGHQPLNLR